MKCNRLILGSVLALSLVACDKAQTKEAAPKQEAEPVVAMPSDEVMDHSEHEPIDGTVGHGTGMITSVGSEGNFLTINHGPIEGIGMGAMTMGFDTLGQLDLSGFSKGDQIAFMVKKGRDNSYRISAICNTNTNGADCLNDKMDH